MSSSSWLSTRTTSIVALAVATFFGLVIRDGLQRLRGLHVPKLRPRLKGQSAEDWLMGRVQSKRCELDLPGLTIRVSVSSANTNEWSADVPPRLACDGMSHLHGWLGAWVTAFLFPDMMVRPESVRIGATAAQVWEVLLDFEHYEEWNPFHRRVDIVELPNGMNAVQMHVHMGGLMGRLVSSEAIYYVDSRRHILVYGIGRDGPISMRTVWLTSESEHVTWFHSYDLIGGYAALFSRWYIESLINRGFSAQHQAIKKRVEDIVHSRLSYQR